MSHWSSIILFSFIVFRRLFAKDAEDLFDNHRNVTKLWMNTFYQEFSIFSLREEWINVEELANHKLSSSLSGAYRRALLVNLPFKFPFYDGFASNITIATGGFCFLGDSVHSWNANDHYIAPLMASNFQTTNSDSQIHYGYTDDFFVVEWRDVTLRHQENAGKFTFELVLYKNGDIQFLYQKIPVSLNNINTARHPLKVGLSNFGSYSRIDIPHEIVQSRTVIYIIRKRAETTTKVSPDVSTNTIAHVSDVKRIGEMLTLGVVVLTAFFLSILFTFCMYAGFTRSQSKPGQFIKNFRNKLISERLYQIY